MNDFKNIMIAAIFGVCLFADVNAYPCVSDAKDIIIRDENDANEISQHKHDWECKYIIEDNYHGTVQYHYVDNYIRNVDASISFSSFCNKAKSLLKVAFREFNKET